MSTQHRHNIHLIRKNHHILKQMLFPFNKHLKWYLTAVFFYFMPFFMKPTSCWQIWVNNKYRHCSVLSNIIKKIKFQWLKIKLSFFLLKVSFYNRKFISKKLSNNIICKSNISVKTPKLLQKQYQTYNIKLNNRKEKKCTLHLF